jgi:tetratricopeptide (TPR) repeat protein
MRARTIWLTAGGIVAATVAIVIIPQTRDVLFEAVFLDELMRRCDSHDPAVAMPACTEMLESRRYETIRDLVLRKRAQLYSDAGKHALAIKDLDERVRLFPDDPDAHLDLGSRYADVEDYDRAIAEYSEVIRLDPKHPLAFLFRSGVKKKKGDLAGAAADEATAYRLEPNLPPPLAAQ